MNETKFNSAKARLGRPNGFFNNYILYLSNVLFKYCLIDCDQWHVTIQTKFESTWCVHHRDLNNGKKSSYPMFRATCTGLCSAMQSWIMSHECKFYSMTVWLCLQSFTIHHHTVPFTIWYVTSEMIPNMWYVTTCQYPGQNIVI